MSESSHIYEYSVVFRRFILGLLVSHPGYAFQAGVITGTNVVGNDVTLQLKTTNPTNVTRWESSVYSDILGYIVEIDGNCMASDVIGQTPSLFAWHCHRQTAFSLILKNFSHRWHNSTWTGIAPFQGSATQTFILYINVPMRNVDITPRKSIIDVIENKEVQLMCKTSGGRPFADVYWYSDMLTPDDTSDDVMITGNNTAVRETDSEGLGVTTGNLRFYPTSRDNGIRIYCSANNSDLDSVKSKVIPMLNVIYNRDIRFYVYGHMGQTSVTVREDTDVILKCSVNSNPSSQIRIMHENKTITESNSMTSLNSLSYDLGKLTCGSSDRYTCTSNNSINVSWAEVRNISLSVQCRPKPYEPVNRTVYARRGAYAVMTVNLISYPKIQHITWKKFENHEWLQLRNTDNTIHIITTSTTTHTALNVTAVNLMFNNVTEEDAGDYMLTAKNTVGLYEEIVTLLVNDSIALVSNSTHGKNLDITEHNADENGGTDNRIIIQVGGAVLGILATCTVVGLVLYMRRKIANRVVVMERPRTDELERPPNIYSVLNLEERTVSEHDYSAICITDANQEKRLEVVYENLKIE